MSTPKTFVCPNCGRYWELSGNESEYYLQCGDAITTTDIDRVLGYNFEGETRCWECIIPKEANEQLRLKLDFILDSEIKTKEFWKAAFETEKPSRITEPMWDVLNEYVKADPWKYEDAILYATAGIENEFKDWLFGR